jgi:hypothetical protein
MRKLQQKFMKSKQSSNQKKKEKENKPIKEASLHQASHDP